MFSIYFEAIFRLRKPKFDVALFSPVSVDIGVFMAKEYLKAPLVCFFFGTPSFPFKNTRIYLCIFASKPALKWPMIDMAVGNPTNPSYIPIEYLNLGQRMSFIERVYNTLFLCVTLTIFHSTCS